MKQPFVILMLVLLTSNANAQLGKGTWFLGGNISGNFENQATEGKKNYEAGGVTIEPLLGYGIGKGYFIGGGLLYSNGIRTIYNTNGERLERSTFHNVGLIVFSRHFTRLADKFYLRAGTNISYGPTLHRFRTFSPDYRQPFIVGHNFGVAVRLALVYFPKPNIGIEFSYGELFYSLFAQNALENNNDPKIIRNRFGFRYGLDGIQVGLVFLIPPKAKEGENR